MIQVRKAKRLLVPITIGKKVTGSTPVTSTKKSLVLPDFFYFFKLYVV